MTQFRALYTLLGLSQDRAEKLLNINHKTVEHYLAGHRRRGGAWVKISISPGIIEELRACWLAIESHADMAMIEWKRSENQKVIIMKPVPRPDISGDWSMVKADMLAAGLLAINLPDDVDVVLSPAD